MRIREKLEHADYEDEAAFQPLLDEALNALRMSEAEFARAFGSVESVVVAWRLGVYAPHRSMRNEVYVALIRLLDTAR